MSVIMNNLKLIFKVLLSFFIFVNSVFSQENNTVSFPDFSILKMDSSSFFTHKDLKDSLNTVFINFSPNCDHCERTIKSILQNHQKITNTQFILTSFEDFSSILKFYTENKIETYSNIYMGQEIDFTLTRQIKYSSFPCLVFFDKHKKYIKTIKEESNAKAVLKALKINSK
jgi:thiol-disulfide isomerase/thioredoxin